MNTKDNKDMLAFAVYCVMVFLWHDLLVLNVSQTKKYISEYKEIDSILTTDMIGGYKNIHKNCMEFVDAYHDEGVDIYHWVNEIKISILKEIEDTPTVVMLLKIINNAE